MVTEQTTTEVLLGVSNGAIDIRYIGKYAGLSLSRGEARRSSGEYIYFQVLSQRTRELSHSHTAKHGTSAAGLVVRTGQDRTDRTPCLTSSAQSEITLLLHNYNTTTTLWDPSLLFLLGPIHFYKSLFYEQYFESSHHQPIKDLNVWFSVVKIKKIFK